MIPEVYQIFKYFENNNVEYIIIGGFAVNIYGYNRNTGDLDILLHDTLENRNRLNQSLIEAGLIPFPSVETMQFVAGYTEVSLPYGIKMDIMTSVKGLEDVSFEVLIKDATVVEVFKTKVNFIDFDNLIKSKLASNRPKDQQDIDELKKINPDSFKK